MQDRASDNWIFMMYKIKYSVGIIVAVILLVCGKTAWQYYQTPIHLVGAKIPPFIKAVVLTLNQLPEFKGRHFTIHTAAFDEANTIPHLIKPNPNAVLWLGGKVMINTDGIDKFGTIITTNPYKKTELKKQKIQSYFLPTGFVETAQQINRGEDFLIIGQPPYVEKILKSEKIPYRHYSWQEVIANAKLVSNAKAVIADDPLGATLSFEMPDILLNLIRAEIPVLAHWKGEKTVSLMYWFNDYINFYMYERDAAAMIKEIIKNTPSVQKRLIENKQFVEKYFSVSFAAKNLRNILLDGHQSDEIIKSQSLTLNVPTMVGHYGAGDYWLGKDMANMFDTLGYTVNTSYINSQYIMPAEVFIRLRGLATDYDEYPFGLINLYYLIYIGIDYIDEESYTKQLIWSMRGSDVFISASKYWADKMADLGFESYYLPQFTNPKKFYYDYDESLKSEVLFVGNFHFHRQGLLWAIQKGAPITIYGDNYPKDVAKGKYVDNRILRKYYSSAKIVLNDTMKTMHRYGFISNRIFDATACGALVISDYMPEIEEIYGKSVPMYKNEQELHALIDYYLKHDEERKHLAEMAQKITLKNYTTTQAMSKMNKIIQQTKAQKLQKTNRQAVQN